MFLNVNNGVCHCKSPFDTGIKVWLVDTKEDLATQISGAPNPNNQLVHPEFLPSRHG